MAADCRPPANAGIFARVGPFIAWKSHARSPCIFDKWILTTLNVQPKSFEMNTQERRAEWKKEREKNNTVIIKRRRKFCLWQYTSISIQLKQCAQPYAHRNRQNKFSVCNVYITKQNCLYIKYVKKRWTVSRSYATEIYMQTNHISHTIMHVYRYTNVRTYGEREILIYNEKWNVI